MSSAFVDLAPPEAIARYEPVIGLEVHVQLATATKIFCGCPAGFGAQPNSNVCPVCLGLPGALPVLNRAAVELAIEAALALNCQVRPVSRFARKNYFYPDLPKGYQISQYEEPLAEHGWVEIPVDGALKRIGVTRVHMEDDAGKSMHDGFRDSDRYTYVDLNRSGTPLIEIVGEPDLRTSQEAYDYLSELKQMLQFLDVSTCDMEKGHLRCDANVSVRRKGAALFGTKAEVKNLNSFRYLKLALDHEIARQVAILEGGGTILQETRLFNPDTGETAGMRSKEHAHDYRYFPEPDLAPLRVSDAWLDEIRARLPELPAAKRAKGRRSAEGDPARSGETLVFDEIDAGIGGHAARAVGARLQELGQTRQLLCITHLPQIASLGDRHFSIVKETADELARTTVVQLAEREVVSELVRMLGADADDAAARRHARDLRRAA